MRSTKQPARIGLALGGGGARGFAHIGVIQELERLHIPIFCVAGTSMGALVGGWYAATGNLDSLIEVFRKRPWRSFFQMRSVPRNVGQGGLFDMVKIEKELRSHLGNAAIETLPMKFSAVATSIKTGTEIDFDSGDLVDAICASASLPFVFMPRKRGSDYLMDGGLLNNVPVDLCFRMGADAVLAIDVGYRFSDFNLVGEQGVSFKPWEVYRVADALLNLVGQSTMKFNPDAPNIRLIRPYVSYIATTEFDRMEEAIFAGRKAILEQERDVCAFCKVERPQKTFWEQVTDFLKE